MITKSNSNSQPTCDQPLQTKSELHFLLGRLAIDDGLRLLFLEHPEKALEHLQIRYNSLDLDRLSRLLGKLNASSSRMKSEVQGLLEGRDGLVRA
jgi:hypothetical protein